MKAQKFDVNKMQVASPCPTGWEHMEGDNQKRFCNLCSLHVYNISEMTTQEVRSLVAGSGGRICARMFKRADGTVMTRDCPVGVRAYRRRVSHFAGAVFSAIIGLCSAVFGQTDAKKDEKAITSKDTEITAVPASQNQLSGVKGVVTDSAGAVVPGAQINIRSLDNKINMNTGSSEEGSFNFSGVPAGTYSITITAPGFAFHIIPDVKIEENKVTQLDASQLSMSVGEIVGLISLPMEPVDDVSKTSTTTIITKKVLDKLPF